ncbi:hypothetical protein LTR37_006610 [Vermiconidia calcicola]|uniref:Uncharacterized protein n=1 Tax=Vermiconidia calcicola TaxID=1690605 RepID=A0ACC3NIN7_9PEZI|nr:hypothetical protein LTR37_006610 [Vermiconidia calcicola]
MDQHGFSQDVAVKIDTSNLRNSPREGSLLLVEQADRISGRPRILIIMSEMLVEHQEKIAGRVAQSQVGFGWSGGKGEAPVRSR